MEARDWSCERKNQGVLKSDSSRISMCRHVAKEFVLEETSEVSSCEIIRRFASALPGLLPAWACMGTVRAEVGDPQPSRMYLFIMDASPKSMRVVPASTRDEEARLRAEGWIQWHMAKVRRASSFSSFCDELFADRRESHTHIRYISYVPCMSCYHGVPDPAFAADVSGRMHPALFSLFAGLF